MPLDYTIIIPTLNRRDYLVRAFEAYRQMDFDGRILVLDSSSEKYFSETVELIDKNIDVAGGAKFDWKFLQVGKTPADLAVKLFLSDVETAYCSVCPDDDLVLIPFVKKAVDELGRDCTQEYVGYVGDGLEYERFRLGCLDKNVFYKYQLFWTIDESVERRISCWLRYPSNIVLGVCRTQNMRRAYDRVNLHEFLWPRVFGEVFCSTALLCQGKVGKLAELGCIREKHQGQFFEKIKFDEVFDVAKSIGIDQMYRDLISMEGLKTVDHELLMSDFKRKYTNDFRPPSLVTRIAKNFLGYVGYSFAFLVKSLIRQKVVKQPLVNFDLESWSRR